MRQMMTTTMKIVMMQMSVQLETAEAVIKSNLKSKRKASTIFLCKSIARKLSSSSCTVRMITRHGMRILRKFWLKSMKLRSLAVICRASGGARIRPRISRKTWECSQNSIWHTWFRIQNWRDCQKSSWHLGRVTRLPCHASTCVNNFTMESFSASRALLMTRANKRDIFQYLALL